MDKKKKVDKRFKENPLIRINTRIRSDQHIFAKAEMKKLKVASEGEMHRIMFDYYINAHKK